MALAARAFDLPAVFLLREGDRPEEARVVWAEGLTDLRPGDVMELDAALASACAGEEPVLVQDARADDRFPSVRGRTMVSTLTVRVPADGPGWVRLAVGDVRPRSFGADDIALLTAIAPVVGSAMTAERVARAQASVAAFGRFAMESTDLEATMHRALAVVTEVLDAPMAAVVRRHDRPGIFVVVAARGPVKIKPGDLYDVSPALDSQHASTDPLVVTDWRTERRYDQPQGVRGAGVRALMSVSLLAGGRPWGRLSVGAPSGRAFTSTEVDLLQAVAHLLASAIHRDEVESRLRRTAEAFQRALLPQHLPDIPAVQIAARYQPASGTLVGGDWYDVLDLPHGAVGLVIGDVEGHDSAAASIMGQVRNLVRTYAEEGHSPAEVLRRVNRFVTVHLDRLVTCCYLELHPADLTLTGVRAGHPPPVTITPQGSTQVLALSGGPPLGVDETTDYHERTILLSPGATLVLATDGLLADDEDVLQSVAAVAVKRDEPVESLAALVLAGHSGEGRSDDGAVLVARLTGRRLSLPDHGAARQVRRLFGPFTESPRAARQFVRDVLAAWGSADLIDSGQLAVSELVTNAIVHTTSAIGLTLRSSSPGQLWVGVRDDSDRMAGPRAAATDDISGRGLAIVELLADSWGIDRSSGSGKTVWCVLKADSFG